MNLEPRYSSTIDTELSEMIPSDPKIEHAPLHQFARCYRISFIDFDL